MRNENWLDDVNAQGARRVACALGLSVEESPKRGVRPCPACGAEQRGSKDRRAAAELTSNGAGWHCYRCQAKGNAVSLALRVVLQSDAPDPGGWTQLRRTLADRGLCGSLRDGRPLPPPPSPTHQTPPRRPASAEIAALWESCIPVTDDPEVTSFLQKRGLDPLAVETFQAARALPPSADWPGWAECRGWTWNESGHRLVVPLFGATGRMESFQARNVTGATDFPKGLSPKGYEVAGLVFADALARRLLQSGRLGDGSPASDWVRHVGLVITEGVPDFLTWVTRYSDADERAPAVIGIISGSVTPAIAGRVPDGCPISIRRHADSAGDHYTDAIVALLADRCEVHALPHEAAP